MSERKYPKLTGAASRKFLKAMHEFGYPSLTLAEVEKASNDLASGKEPTSVIGVMLKSILDDSLASRQWLVLDCGSRIITPRESEK